MATPELEAIAERAEALTYTRPDHSSKEIRGGKMMTPTPAAVAFTGELQPATPAVIRRMPEGTDARDVVVVFTGQELKTGDSIQSTLAASMMTVGEDYKVETVEDWREGQFYEVTALRVKGTH